MKMGTKQMALALIITLALSLASCTSDVPAFNERACIRVLADLNGKLSKEQTGFNKARGPAQIKAYEANIKTIGEIQRKVVIALEDEDFEKCWRISKSASKLKLAPIPHFSPMQPILLT